MMKFSRAIGRVKWLSGEKTQRFEDHLCPRPQGASLTMIPRENIIIKLIRLHVAVVRSEE
jgi:hypothetical protein